MDTRLVFLQRYESSEHRLAITDIASAQTLPQELPAQVCDRNPGLKEALRVMHGSEMKFNERIRMRIETLGGEIGRRWAAT